MPKQSGFIACNKRKCAVKQPANAPCAPTEPHPEPVPRKIRKSGTGCLYQINDNLWERSFFTRLPGGKRKKFNVYAETREQCEIKLAEMIERVKAEIAQEKAKLKEGDSREPPSKLVCSKQRKGVNYVYNFKRVLQHIHDIFQIETRSNHSNLSASVVTDGSVHYTMANSLIFCRCHYPVCRIS